MAKTQKTKKDQNIDQKKIIDTYIAYVLENEKKPANVYKFAKDLGISEGDFYDHFNSLDQVQAKIWVKWFNEVKDQLESDDNYVEFSAREKLLAFDFTWIEKMKENRSFVIQTTSLTDWKCFGDKELKELKSEFKLFSQDLIIEGKANEEIESRAFIQDQYPRMFWSHFMFVLKFWIDDKSKGFDKTDAAIEKSVHVLFDLLSKGAVDSMFDLGKFLIQNR